jgi:hypothetical protein
MSDERSMEKHNPELWCSVPASEQADARAQRSVFKRETKRENDASVKRYHNVVTTRFDKSKCGKIETRDSTISTFRPELTSIIYR